MKALQLIKYGNINNSLEIKEIDKPVVKEEDILIEVEAAGINPIDKGIVGGNLKAILALTLPATTGYDVSGTVVETGALVSHFKVGDKVYARVPQEQMGTIAEYVSVQAKAVSLKPENISFEEAAGMPLASLTALQCLEYADISKDDVILIHAGSGGVGSFAVQYAKWKGAFVYTTTGTDNVSWVKNLGADRVIDYKTEDYKTIVKDATIVFDTLGKEYTVDAFDVLITGGKVVSIIGPMDVETATNFGMKDYKMPDDLTAAIKAKDASYKYIWMHPDGEQLAQIKKLVEAGNIKPIVDTIYPLEESTAAYEQLASGRAKGKIIIKLK